MHGLAQTFALQAGLQHALDAHPENLVDPEEKIQFIKDMVLAAEDELHEVLGEIGWKPWATSRHINVDAVKSELVDTFQFFMNLCLAVGMTAEELMRLHAKKINTNYERLQAGYDGVSTKCPLCKRAYDDDAVRCLPPVPEEITSAEGYEGRELAWCSYHNEYLTPPGVIDYAGKPQHLDPTLINQLPEASNG